MKSDSTLPSSGILTTTPPPAELPARPLDATQDVRHQRAEGRPALVARPLGDFVRFWRMFAFILAKSTRERVFEPEYEDFKVEFQRA